MAQHELGVILMPDMDLGLITQESPVLRYGSVKYSGVLMYEDYCKYRRRQPGQSRTVGSSHGYY